MKKLLLVFGLFLSLSVSGVVNAQLKVDGLLGTETRSAATANPDLAKKFGVSANGAGCDSSNKNCGGFNGDVEGFQKALNGQGAPSGGGGGGGLYNVKLQEPLNPGETNLVATNGVDLINKYIATIYKWMASIIGLIAVLMIVVSGIQIIFGGASPEMVSDAKTRVVQSLLSLVLLFCTALILKTVNPGFFGI